MTCIHLVIILPSTLQSLQVVPVKTKRGEEGEPGISAALDSLFLSATPWFSQIPQQIYVNAHPYACGCRYKWRQPVRADRPDDVLTAINMAKKITNRNEPPDTSARSTSVQWTVGFYTTSGLIIIRGTTS